MIDKDKLNIIIDKYKKSFYDRWTDEKYKWEAVKHFQDNWNIDAENFGEMFNKATEKTGNLLSSSSNYPRAIIVDFAKVDDEATRNMFRNLFDESCDLSERVKNFQNTSELLRKKYDEGSWKQHFQSINAISTYLWLMYPDKYYIYKYNLYNTMSVELKSDYQIKANGAVDNIINGFKMYDEICSILNENIELHKMLKKVLTDECYFDNNLKTLTIDMGYFVGKVLFDEEWFPKNYNPGITVEQWKELLQNSSIFTIDALKIMKRIKDYGGQATCTQLSLRYGGKKNYYNSGSSALAKRIAYKTNCKVMQDSDDRNKWWPILYEGKKANDTDAGSYIWRLRSELSDALETINLDEIPLFEDLIPSIWKISEGTESSVISVEDKKIFLDRNVVVVHSYTRAKGTSKVTQGQHFINTIKKGDYFYLCYGNSIQLLGQFTSDKAVENPELKNGWYERAYRIVKKTDNNKPFSGEQKWWTPNSNSTCIKIEQSDYALFEELILKPYFDMSVEEMMNNKLTDKRYWWLTANPRIWSFSNMKIGEEQNYTLYNERGNKRRIFQNFLDAKIGDTVIGYEANPVKKIVAIAEITKSNDGHNIFFTKKEGLSVPIDYATLKSYSELEKMEFFTQNNGSLFKLTKNEFDFIMDIIREENPVSASANNNTKYTKTDFLDTVFISENRLNLLTTLLRNKMNIILQGAPGVGKTFIAKKLAYLMMGEVDDSRIELVQFHQNYSYEDFIMGYRPDGAAFSLKDGIFHRFCRIATNNPNKDYFFIIDEINRGNMSKIFGELMMLIEKDYRGTKATLAYNGMTFSVPENVYIIGMMNTADRSLAMIDYALRRRFSFFEIEPGFDSAGFKNYQNKIANEKFDMLIDQIKLLNKEIADDTSLGRGFRIGHSYFCGKNALDCTTQWMKSVVEFDILPMLSEYWFDEPEKLQRWENNLRGVFDDE